jgi:hypothetical protein
MLAEYAPRLAEYAPRLAEYAAATFAARRTRQGGAAAPFT